MENTTMQFGFKLDNPDKNGRIITKEVMEKALEDKLSKGSIPITIGSSYDRLDQCLSVDPSKKVGMIKEYDLDNLTANVELVANTPASEIIKELIGNEIPLSLGYRAVGHYHDGGEIDKLDIVSFEVIE
ncbi:MAG: hypothetical protein NC548_15600 [Lachnospiraceae bacterium]|nr:hypothetical protein [Lachnospiraceae bacterium]